MTELKTTPLHSEHQRLGARLVPFAGWEMPVQYAGVAIEHQAVRQRAGLFDVSHMGELWLSGKGAAEVVDGLVTNDLSKVSDGQAMYTCCCNDQGTILDDLIVYRYDAEKVLIVCNASNREKIAAHFSVHTPADVSFDDASDDTALIALQGPKAIDTLLRAGTGLGDAMLPERFRFVATTVNGRPATIARTGYTGEDGVEIFCANLDAIPIWQALLEAGAVDEILPIGLGARDTLRLEARLALYGNEIDETTNPIEAGLGWTVKLGKPRFIGQQALARIQASGPARRLVGFEMTGRGVARHGYPLLDTSGKTLGVCTSGSPSPTLGKSIGLGYVPVAMTPLGTEIIVDCRGRHTSARIVKTPFYTRPASR